jgi:hypothetical protein
MDEGSIPAASMSRCTIAAISASDAPFPEFMVITFSFLPV